jgi:RHS repeat-associated protein
LSGYLNGIEFVGEGTVASRLSSINPSGNGRKAYEAGASGESRIEYYHTDHLGNVRLAFSDLDGDNAITVRDIYYPANEIVQERHYYPFGLTHTGPWFATVAPDNAYRYNGKELDEATGHYFYGFRMYDPAIGRFTGVDPIADQFAFVSVYNYAENEPVGSIDLWGLQRVSMTDGDRTIYSGDYSDAPNDIKSRVDAIAEADGVCINDYICFSHVGPQEVEYSDRQGAKQRGVFAEWSYAYGGADGEANITGEGALLVPAGNVKLGSGAVDIVLGGVLSAVFRPISGGLVNGTVQQQSTTSFSSILNFTRDQVMTKWKHAADFGVSGGYSFKNAPNFVSAINQHINASGTQVIQGAYRNSNNLVTYYLNPSTGLNVIASRSGQFITGARLSTNQVNKILTKGFLW